MNTDLIVSAAKAYAALGWHVLPVVGKVPQGAEWQEHATATNVEALFASRSFDGVGVLLGSKSGIVDIECDSDEAEETLLDLLHGEIPNTPTFQSARGRHYLFRWREGLPKTAVFKLHSLEFRTGNGAASQSVFPPSNGREWVVGPETPVAEFPAWDRVLKALEESRKRKEFAKPKRNGAFADGPRYGDGTTLDVPRWLAKHGREILHRDNGTDGATRWFIECPAIDRHTTENAARDCVVTQEASGKLGGKCFHQSCGMDSWDSLRDAIGALTWEDFQEPIVANAAPVDLSGLSSPGKPAAASVAVVEPEVKAVEPLAPVGFREEFLDVPGIVGRVYEHNMRTALYPRPELALAGALALMGLITGRKVMDRWALRPNVYIVGLCNSGGGKSHAKQVNNQILGALGKQEMLMARPKSGSGLITSLRESPASLLQIDELADWLEIMKSPQKSPHTYEILGLLKEVYSEAKNEFWKPSGYADSKKNPVVANPHLVFYGVAPASSFWQSLTKQNLTDGLVGRLLAVESIGENVSNDDAVDDAPPAELLNDVRAWIDFSPGGGNLAMLNAKAVRIQHTEDAWARYREHGKQTEKRREGESEEAYAVWCRTPEKTGKLAMLRACSRVAPVGGALPVVELRDVEWAIAFSNWVTRTMLQRAGLYVAENAVEGNLLRVLRMLDDWRSREWIGRNARWLKAKERDDILRDAVANEMIEAREVETEKRARVEFRRRL